MDNRYTVKYCTLTGGFWVIDNNYARGMNRYNEWFATQEEADLDAAAKNKGKTRTCKPRSEETKERMRLAREKKKSESEPPSNTSKPRIQRRSKKTS